MPFPCVTERARRGTVTRTMRKKKSHKVKLDPKRDDLWAWVVIGIILSGVTLALYGPLVWQATHG